MKSVRKMPILLVSCVLLASGCGAATTKEDTKTPNSVSSSAPVQQTNATQASNEEALKQEIDQYHKFVIEQCDLFVKSTDSFVKAVKAGDIAKAKELYAPSRMYFERIEPIAESLGEFDPKIDARENDVPANEWTGFHRIEKFLWVDKSTKGAEKYADQLLQDVKLLRAKVETVQIDAPLLVTGAVELLNEVSSSKVTGEEERYSHTDLYDFAANVEGAKKIFDVIRPALEKKDAALAKEIEGRFSDLDKAIAPYRKGEGFVLYTELTKEQTKKLSQAIDALAEPLSKMGTVLEA